MTWTLVEIESTAHNLKFGIEENGSSLTHRRFLELLNESQDFRRFYNRTLAESRFEAFLWENKPLVRKNLDENYECNLVKNTYLAGASPDSHTFSQYFDSQKNVVVFPNLGRDAVLIAPCPRQNKTCYPHIGTFVRRCDEEQIDDFWRITGEQMVTAVGDEPKWLSTSGLGVFWLHVRIDSRPKYYQTPEYKKL